MESVARQFARGRRALIVRNGWFSYRWTQIFEAGGFAAETHVAMARRAGNDLQAPFAPAAIEDVAARIAEVKPDVVFAPHVETASGMILPEGLSQGAGARSARRGRAFRAGLHRLGLHLGRHEGCGGRCTDLRAAKGVVGLAFGGPCDDVRRGRETA